jgi:hypothetical protein
MTKQIIINAIYGWMAEPCSACINTPVLILSCEPSFKVKPTSSLLGRQYLCSLGAPSRMRLTSSLNYMEDLEVESFDPEQNRKKPICYGPIAAFRLQARTPQKRFLNPAFRYFFLDETWVQSKKLTIRIFSFHPWKNISL